MNKNVRNSNMEMTNIPVIQQPTAYNDMCKKPDNSSYCLALFIRRLRGKTNLRWSPNRGYQKVQNCAEWNRLDCCNLFLYLVLSCDQMHVCMGGPGWCSGKESTCQCRRYGFDLWVRKLPCSRKWQPIPVFLPGKCQGQWSLAGYSWTWLRHTHSLILKIRLSVFLRSMYFTVCITIPQ